MEKTIAHFLEVLEKFKSRLEKIKSHHNPEKNAYQFLLDDAHDFSGVDVEPYVDELFALLTVENAERITNAIIKMLPGFSPNDQRVAFVTAYGLVQMLDDGRYTKDWVKNAEDALEDLKILSLADQLTNALKPFGVREDDFVVGARALLVAEVTKSWPKKVYEVLKKLEANKPRDIAMEAKILKTRIEEELAEKGFENDRRQTFFEAKELAGVCFVETPEWVEEAIIVLVLVRCEKAKIKANRAERWWTKHLPETLEAKPLDDLRGILDEKPERYHEALWVVRVYEALEALKTFNPKCSQLGCTANVSRKDGGNGQYHDKCRDHGVPVKTVADLSVPATGQKVAELEAMFNGGKGKGKKKKKKADNLPEDLKEEIYV